MAERKVVYCDGSELKDRLWVTRGPGRHGDLVVLEVHDGCDALGADRWREFSRVYLEYHGLGGGTP